MRNFKDLSRALASIAGGLKGIKDIIDTIEPGGGGVGGVDYSTTETDTGLKWIDGSVVYQLVISIEALSTGTQVDHNISNFGDLVEAYAVIEKADGFFVPIPTDKMGLFVSPTKWAINTTDTSINGRPGFLFLRYTKSA